LSINSPMMLKCCS